MYAIVEIGGMQFRVAKAATVRVPKMELEPGKTINLDRVLMIVNGEKVDVGTPVIANAVVKATVVSHFKDKKVLVFKKKRRKNYKVLRGHRQDITEIKIDAIHVGQSESKAAAKTTEKEADTKLKLAAVKRKAPAKATAVKAEAKVKASTAKAETKKTAAKSTAATEKKTAVKKPTASSKTTKAPSKPSKKKEA